MRIQFKSAALVHGLGQTICQEDVLQFRVSFFQYEAFLTLFLELFVGDPYLLECSRPDPIILDCGSNIGMSVVYFKSLYPACRIVAFEPDPVTFEMLKRNVEGNNLSGVELHNVGLGAAAGRGTLYFQENVPGWLSQSATASMDQGTSTKPVSIEPLSPYISQEIDILKMDIEGAEGAVLVELESSGRLKLVRQLVLEYHHHIHPDEDSLASFLAVLERNGFGYHFAFRLRTPFAQRQEQAFIIYAYRK